MAEHSMCQPGRPGPPGARPLRLARLGRFPQREVERAALLLADLDARAGLEIVWALSGQSAVRGKPADGIVDVAARGVGEALVAEAADESDDVRDVGGGARLVVGGAIPSATMSDAIASSYLRATASAEIPSACARRMILSSTSVTLRTNRTARPDARR